MEMARKPVWPVPIVIAGLILAGILIVTGSSPMQPAEPAAAAHQPSAPDGDAPDCGLLGRPEIAATMLGLERKLMALCGRLGKQPPAPPSAGGRLPFASLAPLGTDVQENNYLLDPYPHYHQDESDLAVNANTICSNYNDSGTYDVYGTFMGFSVSTDGGASFSDRSRVSPLASSFGDPGMIYRQADGFFYASSLGNPGGLFLYKSTDNCQTFGAPSTIHGGINDDKPMMRVDNNVSSPFYGRMYVCFTNFNIGGFPIQVTWSSNGGTTWSAPPVTVSTGNNVQGCWPGVAPNGDVYVVYIQGYTTGINNIQMARSTNGGASFFATANVATGITEPGVSVFCYNSFRPTMNGDIRTWAMPQVAIAPSGRVHVTYTRKDGSDRGNIYYQYSDTSGMSWSAPVRMNDDSTTNDQWFSTIAVNANGTVVISWYDRREDPGNMLFRRYAALSYDNGNTWQPNVAVGDVLSPVPPLNPNFDPYVLDCYMGDYDAVAIDANNAYIQWSDNRNLENDIQQPDMFMDRIVVALTPTPTQTATPTHTPTRTPGVSLVKVNNPFGTVQPGGRITYTISYSNIGGLALGGIVITDTVPWNTLLDQSSINPPAIVVVGTPPLILWSTLPTVVPGESNQVAFSVVLPSITPTPVGTQPPTRMPTPTPLAGCPPGVQVCNVAWIDTDLTNWQPSNPAFNPSYRLYLPLIFKNP